MASPSLRELRDAIDAMAALGARTSLADEASTVATEVLRMHRVFEGRTGSFGPDDPWFEARSRAFWDDALTTQAFADVAAHLLPEHVRRWRARLATAHRGLFLIKDDVGSTGHTVVDQWSGAEFVVTSLDEAQADTFAHADGLIDGRVVAASDDGTLAMLPGAFHHGPDAHEPIARVLDAARERKLATDATLDALMKMELVFRRSSRVKVGFAYRVESLPPRAPITETS